MKPSDAQLRALSRIVNHAKRGGTYMPYVSEQRSFDACEDRKWVEYRKIENGSPYNGYALTDEGKSIYDEHKERFDGTQ